MLAAIPFCFILKVWVDGETFPNRLQLVKEYVKEGGSFMMIG